jgi:hypothetical protein
MFCGNKTFFCKFGRAVLRVAVAVAVVAVIAVAPVAAIALAKKLSFFTLLQQVYAWWGYYWKYYWTPCKT